jgi:hypothetical protein
MQTFKLFKTALFIFQCIIFNKFKVRLLAYESGFDLLSKSPSFHSPATLNYTDQRIMPHIANNVPRITGPIMKTTYGLFFFIIHTQRAIMIKTPRRVWNVSIDKRYQNV